MLDRDLALAAARLARVLDGGRVACAESCTSGLIAQALADAPGASDWFLGGIVTYHRQAKSLLGVGPGPVVTCSVADQMAVGAARLFGADLAVSTTGAAGPASLDGAPPGTVVIGWYVDGDHGAEIHHIEGDRHTVCQVAARQALHTLTARLLTLRSPKL